MEHVRDMSGAYLNSDRLVQNICRSKGNQGQKAAALDKKFKQQKEDGFASVSSSESH
jgi:hypothetical protein